VAAVGDGDGVAIRLPFRHLFLRRKMGQQRRRVSLFPLLCFRPLLLSQMMAKKMSSFADKQNP
jgi:hypothetical protein